MKNYIENGDIMNTITKDVTKKDRCVMCSKKTEYDIHTHIDLREHYIEGAGQMCNPCHQRIY